LSIDVAKKVSHWPLIKYINQDDLWPVNIYEHLRKQYPKKQKQIDAYKLILRTEILKPDVYLPFTRSLDTIGCSVTLSERFADPIYFGENRSIKKSELIEWDVIDFNVIRKDVYPLFNGTVDFDVVCAKNQ